MFVFLGKVIFLVVLCERACPFPMYVEIEFSEGSKLPRSTVQQVSQNEQQNHGIAALIDVNSTKVVSLIMEP